MESVTKAQFSTTKIRTLPFSGKQLPSPIRLQFEVQIEPDHPHYSDFVHWRALDLSSALLALAHAAGSGPFLLVPDHDPPMLYQLSTSNKIARRLAEAFENLFRYGEPNETAVRLVERLAELIDDQAHDRDCVAEVRQAMQTLVMEL
jgi:hypothetical protein